MALFFTIALIIGGCQAAPVRQTLTSTLPGSDPHSQSEFWYEIGRRPVTTNDDAFHALLLYVDGTDRATDYAARVRQLTSRGMLPAGFDRPAGAAVDRGTLAVAMVKVLKIEGGLTMRLIGPTPRYAVRALEDRGVFPPSSPNQGVSGADFVGIMQKAEEFQHGSPAIAPAAVPPAYASSGSPDDEASQLAMVIPPEVTSFDLRSREPLKVYLPDPQPPAADSMSLLPKPLFLAPDVGQATTEPTGIRRLNVIVTGVQGDAAEMRADESAPWARARRGMVLHENAEFRTGAKSAVQFIIPPDQTFSLDSQGTLKVLQAVASGKKEKTEIGIDHGRVREDLTASANPVRIEEAGIEHDTTLRSPNSALALRGTKVSLFEQSGFEPEAISLTGRAVYVNTRGQRVPFGGRSPAVVRGAQASPVAEAAARSSALQTGIVAINDFQAREISIVVQRGGFVTGNVVVGNLRLSDFPKLPGALDFVLQWSGGPHQNLNDLNLAVFSPLNSRTSPDFVANPPFTISLSPNSPASIQARASNYPRTSATGGQISRNSVGPDGLELAAWPANHPTGTYRVVVYNLLDAKPAPTQTINPVTYTIDVFLNGRKLINTYTSSVGLLQTSPALLVPVPVTAATARTGVPKPISRRSGARN